MSTTANISPRLAALCATGAGLAAIVGGVLQLTDEQSSETTVVGVEHVTIGALTTLLVLLIPVMLYLGRLAGRPRTALIASVGMGALAALTVTSNVNGEDLGIFPAVAIPSNLLWFGGSVALAIALKRGGQVPAFVAVGLPLTWILSLPLSQVGGGVVAGGFWLAVGWLLANGELARRTAARPA